MDNTVIILANIIDNCNYDCHYCYNKKPYTKSVLNLDYLYKLIIYILNLNKKIILNLEGGEPTLHSNLFNFLFLITKLNNIQCYIYSNASQSTFFYNKLLSLDNINLIATIHNNNEKDYTNILNIDNNLKNKIELNIMYEDYDIFKSIDLYKKALIQLNNNVNLIYIFRTVFFIPKYTKYQTEIFFDTIKDKQIDNIQINNNFLKINESNLGFYTKKISFKYQLCDAGKQSLYIHNNGKIYYCPSFYEENKNSICTIFNFKNIIKLNKQIFCICDHCQDYINIKKQKIFNKK